MRRILELGVGHRPQYEDSTTLDIREDNDPDVVHDLEQVPYPFDDNQFDKIVAFHVLEHITDWPAAFREIHRILKPGGKLHMRWPHPATSVKHPDHEWHAVPGSLVKHLDPNHHEYIGGVDFEVDVAEVHWRHYNRRTGYLGKIGRVIDRVFNSTLLGALHTRFMWSIGGFEECELVLTKNQR